MNAYNSDWYLNHFVENVNHICNYFLKSFIYQALTLIILCDSSIYNWFYGYLVICNILSVHKSLFSLISSTINQSYY